MKTIKEAIKFLADKQSKEGDIPFNRIGCLIPSFYLWRTPKQDKNICADILYDVFKATHYTREYEDDNNVKITLYAAQGFGAVDVNEQDKVKEFTIEVNREKN